MKFLKRLILKWVDDARNEKMESRGIRDSVAVRESNSIDSEPIINFRIYNAQNGKIIEFSKYDRVKDRSDRSLYIVQSDEELVEKLPKYVSMELMK